jgi:ectoine hydroxylase-related dioxygenase (phytanoyl-CoA dioxygenase family)
MALKPTLVLTKEQIEFYHREGYLKLEGLMPPEEIERMKVIYDRLFEAQVGRKTGEFFDLAGRDEDNKPKTAQLMNPSKFAPELASGEWQYKVNATAIAKQLQGEKSYFRQDLAICKPAKSAAPTMWHQDSAYNDPKFDYDNLNVWIPLQDVNEENGCMSFVPRSHIKKEILKHHRPDPKVEGIECLEVDLKKATPMHLPAGGCTIHHARLLHYASGNHSNGPRRAFILEYEVPPVKRAVAHVYTWNDNRQTKRAKQFSKLSTRVGNRLRGLKKKLIGA